MSPMSIVLFVAAVSARAFFALARSALIHVRRPRLVELEQKGVTSARLIQHLTDNSSQLLATAEVGALFSLVIAASIATLEFVSPMADWMIRSVGTAISPALAGGLAYVIVILLTSMILYIFGRLAPEAIAVRHAEQIALATVGLMQLSSVVLSPFVRVAVALSNWLSLPLGGQKRDSATLVTEEELKTMVDAGQEEGLIEQDEKAMILSVLDFGDTVAREVMVPRIDMVAIEVSTPLKQALDVIIEAGHSRIPVYRNTIDDIVGILYAKDLLRILRDGLNPPLEQVMRQPYFTPESKKVSDLLQELQSRRVHICIVIDEYGGTAGLVTIEDILEEIVGDIQDEFDKEEPEYVALPEGAGYILDAGMNLDDVNELMRVQLPTDESDTLGGFIYDQLGEVPQPGDIVCHAGLRLEVLAVSERRILKVKATYEQTQPPADETQPETEREAGREAGRENGPCRDDAAKNGESINRTERRLRPSH
ncbi:MAG: hemolysin family protein [Anaerolineae bacterium]|nr:hemolysin family protein [Thermoflexales bacterium]MDW8408145.1 hemolysin family protein [Anaerolineae bacterium]